jgi:3-carboxy-cis,cis-muconate cycloisomerase
MAGNAFEAWLSSAPALEAFSPTSVVQAMLAFQAALAQAQAAEGLVPPEAAQAIVAQCQAGQFDAEVLVAAAGRAGSLAVPLLAALKSRVAQTAPPALPWVHWGSSEQDMVDTAMALITQRLMARIDADVMRAAGALLALAAREGDAPMLVRSLMQPASATTLGLKLAAWTAPLLRSRAGIARAGYDAFQVQLGGAEGSLAVMGSHGPAVAARMAERLGLAAPVASWHTQRDNWVSLGCELAVLVGAIGKLAGDWVLLGQPEIGELGEAAPTSVPQLALRSWSAASIVMLAAAHRAPQRAAGLLASMVQEHEQGLGNWQAELAEWAGLWTSAAGAAAALADMAPRLAVDRARMAANLQAQGERIDIDAAVAAARERAAGWLAALRDQHERVH